MVRMSTSTGAQRLERLLVSSSRVSPRPTIRLDLVWTGVADLDRHLLGPAQDVEGAVPAGALADRLLESPDGLEVVVEDVRPGVHHRPQSVVRAVEVGDEDLDAHARRSLAHPR